MVQAGSSLIQPSVGDVFRCVMPVRWGDLDALNHVNNTLYFRYQEEARVQLFARAGMALAVNKVGVLVHASCDFLKPITYPATVVVSLVFESIGRSSIAFGILIECEDQPGVPYARGRNVMVGTDAKTGRPVPWTDDEIAGLAACFAEGPPHPGRNE